MEKISLLPFHITHMTDQVCKVNRCRRNALCDPQQWRECAFHQCHVITATFDWYINDYLGKKNDRNLTYCVIALCSHFITPRLFIYIGVKHLTSSSSYNYFILLLVMLLHSIILTHPTSFVLRT